MTRDCVGLDAVDRIGAVGLAMTVLAGLVWLGLHRDEPDGAFDTGPGLEALGLAVVAAGSLIVLLAGLLLWATDRFSADRQADEAYERVRSRSREGDSNP